MRAHLRIDGDRLLANPRAPGHGAAYRIRGVQTLTNDLAAAAKLDHLAGGHTPSRWARSYAHRILEAPTGSMITLMWLHGRRSWAALEKAYGTTTPATNDLTIDDVYADTTLPGLPDLSQKHPTEHAA